jgi:hypothetical protein
MGRGNPVEEPVAPINFWQRYREIRGMNRLNALASGFNTAG